MPRQSFNIIIQGKEMKKTEEPSNSNGSLSYAFIYCTIFLLALFVAVQFESLIEYRYPVLLLVVAVILLFLGTSLQEFKQKGVPQSKTPSILVVLLVVLSTSIVLVLMVIPESHLLFLLIPLALGILILEWFRARCNLHNDST
jgi:predicted neutral ceramidase superfamily lipid hydrolase